MTTAETSTTDEAISRYRAALSRWGQVQEFRLDGLDRLGIPITSCSLVVQGKTAHAGNGYGLTEQAAVVSGLGELAEGAVSAHHLPSLRAEEIVESRQAMVRRHGADRVVDPRTLCLPVGSAYADDRPLHWWPMRRVATGEQVWAPEEFVANEPAELTGSTPLLTPITNGLGAGLDADRAVLHGLLELLQRHTNATRFRALDRLSPAVAHDDLPADAAALVAEFARRGVEVIIKHAGTEFGVVSTYAMGHDADPPQSIMVTACGEAASLDVGDSLVKSILEYANSRARKAFCFGDPDRAHDVAPAEYWSASSGGRGEQQAYEAMQHWADLGPTELRRLTAPAVTETVPGLVAPPGPSASGIAARLDHVRSRLAEGPIDHDVLTVISESDGVVVGKTVVTGLECETLSYGRLGEIGAARLLATDTDLVRCGDRAEGSHRLRVVLTADAEERLGGPVWWSPERAEQIVGPLYPLYREPARHSVAVR